MIWVYGLLVIVGIILLAAFLLIRNIANLFVHASDDAYAIISTELTLEERVVDILLKSKSPHLKKYVQDFFAKILCYIDKDEDEIAEMESNEKVMREQLMLELLGMMERSDLIEKIEDSYTREEMKSRMYLVKDLPAEDIYWYQSFMNNTMPNDPEDDDPEHMGVTFIRKKPGWKRSKKAGVLVLLSALFAK